MVNILTSWCTELTNQYKFNTFCVPFQPRDRNAHLTQNVPCTLHASKNAVRILAPPSLVAPMLSARLRTTGQCALAGEALRGTLTEFAPNVRLDICSAVVSLRDSAS